MSNEWIWYIQYQGNKRHLLLVERDSQGTLLVALGCFFLNRACGRLLRRVRLDGPVYRLATWALNAVDKHEKVLVSIPIEGLISDLLKGSVDLEEVF